MKIIKRVSLLIVSLLSIFIFMDKLNASSGYISVSSNRNSLVVGGSVYVDVTISSSDVLGTWEFSISYDSSKLRLESGTPSIVDYGDGSTKSRTYSYTFKSIAEGTSTVSVKSYNAYAWDETSMSLSAGSTSISAITQAQLEASYSTNNNLSEISLSEGTLSPEFNKETLDYTVVVGSNVEKITIGAATEDRYASFVGTGEHAISEGDNKFEIKVTAENGSSKTYTVTVKVEDKNPIEKHIDGKAYTVVKRASSIKVPETYTLIETKIGEVSVPALYSEVTKMTLLAMKNSKGETGLFVYDKINDSLASYNEVKTESAKLYVTETKSVPKGYTLTEIKIGDYTVPAYKKNNTIVINALNIETNKEGLFIYDKETNGIITFSDENEKKIEELNKTNKNYFYIICGLGGESILLLIILIVVAVKKGKLKRKVLEIEKLINTKKDKKTKAKEEQEEFLK